MVNLEHVGITCSNLVESQRFYQENFGLEKTGEMKVSAERIKAIFGLDSSATIVFLKAGEARLELFEFPEAKSLKPVLETISHISLKVDSRQKTYEKIKNMGGETILIDKHDGDFIYFVKDPDGGLIELKD
jgi:catechol 2,3-dioxygenase-like lactoylglutathione lyase family enzyme